MANTSLREVTLSLPQELVSFVDALAESQGSNRSRVIADVIAKRHARWLDKLAREGYRFYATEAEEFAAASRGAALHADVVD